MLKGIYKAIGNFFPPQVAPVHRCYFYLQAFLSFVKIVEGIGCYCCLRILNKHLSLDLLCAAYDHYTSA